MPTTYSAIIPAGVTFGLGIWEFNIGHKLKCFNKTIKNKWKQRKSNKIISENGKRQSNNECS